MRIFLTGGTGFIGHYVAQKLLNDGHELTILARNPQKIPSLAQNAAVKMIPGTIHDAGVIEKNLAGCEACIHLALGWGETPVSMLENDTRVTVFLLEQAAKAGCGKFIYTSSTAAMGKMRPVMAETTSNAPIDLYGATKAAGEAFVLGFKKGYGTHFPQVEMNRNIIRPGYTFGNPAWPDGVSQPDRRFLDMAKAVKENRDIRIIKNDGTQFIHASQQAEIYAKLLHSDCNEEVFLGLSENWIGWKEIAEKMIALTPGTRSKIIEEDLGWADQPILFSVNKINDHFGLRFNSYEFLDGHVLWCLSKV
ncbi:MAG: NAD(P)-dependent oxidoreductase [Fibrobacter sp.]|jgi:UDP-glucose 4-epimerase|nr:NAD(P)-dependent oxidoreductase [Fibrobacter sp.]